MAIRVDDITLTSIEALVAFARGSEALLFELSEPTQFSLKQGLDKKEIVGKNGAKLGELKRNKTVTGSAANGTINLPALAADLGTTVTRDYATTYRWRETLTVNTAAVTLSYTPAGTAGSEMISVRKMVGEQATASYTQVTGTVATGECKLATKTLSFYASDVTNGDVIEVWYDRSITGATVVSNVADEIAKNVHLMIYALAEDRACNVYYVLIDIPNASLGGTVEIGAGDSQVMHNIEFEALGTRCNGTTKKFWDMLVIDDEDIEAAE